MFFCFTWHFCEERPLDTATRLRISVRRLAIPAIDKETKTKIHATKKYVASSKSERLRFGKRKNVCKATRLKEKIKKSWRRTILSVCPSLFSATTATLDAAVSAAFPARPTCCGRGTDGQVLRAGGGTARVTRNASPSPSPPQPCNLYHHPSSRSHH